MEEAGEMPSPSSTTISNNVASAREFWIFPVPPRARWDPESPHKFGIELRVVSFLTALLSEFGFPTQDAVANTF